MTYTETLFQELAAEGRIVATGELRPGRDGKLRPVYVMREFVTFLPTVSAPTVQPTPSLGAAAQQYRAQGHHEAATGSSGNYESCCIDRLNPLRFADCQRWRQPCEWVGKPL